MNIIHNFYFLVVCNIVILIQICSSQNFECPPSWKSYGDSCYKLSDDDQSYADAVATCQVDGANLVSVESSDEHNFISDFISLFIGFDWYTSGRRSSDDKFVWKNVEESIEMTEFFWGDKTQPGNTDLFQVVYHHENGEWMWHLVGNDTVARPYICKVEKKDIFKIIDQGRDFDYGQDLLDISMAKRGPSFIKEPSNNIFYETLTTNSMLSLECQAEGRPMPLYSWWEEYAGISRKLDALTLDENDLSISVTSGILVFNKPSQDEDKIKGRFYYCIAENDYGKIKSIKANVEFGFMDKFPTHTRNVLRVPEYDGYGINCDPPNHYPAVIYTWLNDRGDIISTEKDKHRFISQDGFLYFQSATKDDQGYYQCEIIPPSSNVRQGEISRPIELFVTTGVADIMEPKMVSNFPRVFPTNPFQGSTITIECIAYGSGYLIYSWERVDGPMPPNAKQSDWNRILTIEDVQPQYQGTYKCRVQRDEGQSTESTVQLTINALPHFLKPLKSIHADINTDISWDCLAQGIPPVDKYMWLKNTEPVETSDRIIFEDEANSKLTIKNVKDSDAGMYQCAATNSFSTNISSAQLRVLAIPPSFQKNPLQKKVYGNKGSTVTIICNPEAAPNPVKTWKKDDRDMNVVTDEGSRIYILPNGNLVITQLSNSDAGIYTCTAENDLGTDQSSATLEVFEQMRMLQVPETDTVSLGGTAFIPCQAMHDEYLDVTYVWKHNNYYIQFIEVKYFGDKYHVIPEKHFERGAGTNRGGLYIRDVQFFHEGIYTCIVETSIGTLKNDPTKLRVIGPPGPPAGLTGTEVKATSIKLRWFEGAENGRPIKSYMIEGYNEAEGIWRELKTNVEGQDVIDCTTTVTGLNPASVYKFRARASNILGTGEPSDSHGDAVKWYTTEASPPINAPSNIGGGGGKIGTLVITWDPMKLEDYNGENLYYIVAWKRADMEQNQWDTQDIQNSKQGKFVKLLGGSSEEEKMRNYYRPFNVMIQAINDMGKGPWSDEATIYSAEGIPLIRPDNVMMETYNSTALRVTWTPVEQRWDTVLGVIIGYRVNYWLYDEKDNPDKSVLFKVVKGNVDNCLIIGLQVHVYYQCDVQVMNSAGLSPISLKQQEETLRHAPIEMPTEVTIHSMSRHSIMVMYRGIDTSLTEEPLVGYIIRYWKHGESYYTAKNFDAEKKIYVELPDLEENVHYNLRVLGYSRGGEGRASSPALQFIIEDGDCMRAQTTPNQRYYYKCDSCTIKNSFIFIIFLLFLHTLAQFL